MAAMPPGVVGRPIGRPPNPGIHFEGSAAALNHLRTQLHLIHVAPAPVLAWFEGPDDRMLHAVKMLGGVLVFRRIATAHVAASEAQPQVHPCISYFEAFLAAAASRLDIAHLIEVCACVVHIMTSQSKRKPFGARGRPSRRDRFAAGSANRRRSSPSPSARRRTVPWLLAGNAPDSECEHSSALRPFRSHPLQESRSGHARRSRPAPPKGTRSRVCRKPALPWLPASWSRQPDSARADSAPRGADTA